MPFDAEVTTKKTALGTFEAACIGRADWETAARALASVLQASQPRQAVSRAPKPNKRQGAPSKAFPGLKLPLFTAQACGHTLNTAGCAVCITCQTARRRIVSEPQRRGEAYTPPPAPALWALQDQMREACMHEHCAINIARMLAAWSGRKRMRTLYAYEGGELATAESQLEAARARRPI